MALTATDARVGIGVAIGADAADTCLLRRNVVLSLADARRFGALGVSVDYSAGGGAFSQSGGEIFCETLVADTVALPIHARRQA